MLPEASERGSVNKQSEFLPYALDYIPDDLRKRAKAELFEDEETRVKCLQLFKAMLKEEKDLDPPEEDAYLLAYLRTRKFDVKRALNLMKTGYNVLRKRNELYYNFDFELVRRTITENDIGMLPHRDSEGCVILVIRAERWNPPQEHHTLGDVMRALTAGLIHASLYPATHIAGFKVIFDFDGFKLRQLPHASPTYLWLFGEALQNCFPARFKAIHMVNVNHLVTYIWIVLKSFLSKKLQDRFHFHGKSVTNEKLHKFFDPKILPAEYDGKLPSFRDVNKEWINMMIEKQDEITKLINCGYWRSKPLKPEELKKAKKEVKMFNIK